ncbi:histidine phosphatase family protein [Acidithiobacillus sp. AMEEHan]|uniref:SixA phosphatase family protein n=1 Tax=Acidithiobacillus sp. AMEEHan TaxID=2994951 RepID=UPI0027E48783|nr:histidine phosphatase family protein [Acidithiobacillus sp. AMEEHan]
MGRRCNLDLVLIRHAEAEEHSADGADASRRLTARGAAQAAGIARALRQFPLQDAEIWYSPKERTRQTAAALQAELQASVYRAEEALITGNLSRLQFAWQEDQAKQVILVGHQPLLGDWIAQLAGIHLPIAKASVTFLREKTPGGRFQFLGHFRPELFAAANPPEKNPCAC